MKSAPMQGVQRTEKEAARQRQAPADISNRTRELESATRPPASTPNAALKQEDTLLTVEHEKSEFNTG
jgi:hypothetical protein